MGHNVSVVNGVRSENFYEQRNGIHEIWVDDTELISRLPFGDSDLGQSSWQGKWPKIPWHQFIIPLKRDINSSNFNSSFEICLNATALQDFHDNTREVFKMSHSPSSVSNNVPNTPYWSIFNGMDRLTALCLGGSLLIISWALWILVIHSSWHRDTVKEEMHRRFPRHSDGVHTKMVPDRITSWGQIRPWLLRYALRNAVPSTFAFLLLVISIPALTYAMTNMDAADLMMILGCNLIFYFSVRFLIDILLTSYALYDGIKTNQRNQALEVEYEEKKKTAVMAVDALDERISQLEKRVEQSKIDIEELIHQTDVMRDWV